MTTSTERPSEPDGAAELAFLLGRHALGGAYIAFADDPESDEEGRSVLLVVVDGCLYALYETPGLPEPCLRSARDGGPGWRDGAVSGDLVRQARRRARAMVVGGIPCVASPRTASSGVWTEDHIVEVRDRRTSEVLLEVGWEWYEYPQRDRLTIPLLQLPPPPAGGLNPPVVQPGGEVELSAAVTDGEYAVSRVVVLGGAGWEVRDVRVGGRSVLSVPEAIPAEALAPSAVDCLRFEGPVTPDAPLSVVAGYVGDDLRGDRLSAMVVLESRQVRMVRARRIVMRAHSPLLLVQEVSGVG